MGTRGGGARNVLTMVAVLRPDIMSSLWFLISPHNHLSLKLNADWSKITITGAEESVQTVCDPFLH